MVKLLQLIRVCLECGGCIKEINFLILISTCHPDEISHGIRVLKGLTQYSYLIANYQYGPEELIDALLSLYC